MHGAGSWDEADAYPDAYARPEIYTGPSTAAQWSGLRHLEAIAEAAEGNDPGGSTQRRDGTSWQSRLAASWPLYVVLAVQAALTLRLVGLDTPFTDEALYVSTGRIELWHWTNGMQEASYATFFSGAPVIYPPLAGVADIVGGLTAARILSTFFMLGTTWMLWGAARSLFGRRAALGAMVLFVALGSTQFLGAYATFDAMALFLLALSARLVIAARDKPARSPLLVAAVAALAASNATKYATTIFDPAIIAIAVFCAPRGLKAGLARGGIVLAGTGVLLGMLLAIGGSPYIKGIDYTTLTRAPGANPPLVVLGDSASWVGVVVAVGLVAIVVAAVRDRPRAWLIASLAVASALVPLNQARIHTTVSLNKHVDFGAWFACIAAGYVVAVVTRPGRQPARLRVAGAVASAAVVLVVGVLGWSQSRQFTSSWPDTAQLVATMRPLVQANPGYYLVEQPDIFEYDMQGQVPWLAWKGVRSFKYRAAGATACVGGVPPATVNPNAPIYQAFSLAIAQGYFSVFATTYTYAPAVSYTIEKDIKKYGTYKRVVDTQFNDGHEDRRMVIYVRTPAGAKASHGKSC